MGNSQGKQLSKKEVMSKLTQAQKIYIDSWCLCLSDEERSTISKTVFVEDVQKRFANMPTYIIIALFECMDPDSRDNVAEDSFFFMAYVILNGSFEEKTRLTYRILQRIGKTSEVSVGCILQFFQSVDTHVEGDKEWTKQKLLRDLEVDQSASADVIITWDAFYSFASQHPTCPMILWINRFQQQIEAACMLRQELADDESSGNAKLSKLFYTNRRNLKYSHIHDMSTSVLMEIYGILSRCSNQGFITKAQWLSEMSKFFPQDLVSMIFAEFSKEQKRLNIYEVVSAMCLLCHDPVDQRLRASLHLFKYTCKSVDQFSAADLIKLFSAGVAMFTIENSFDYAEDTTESEEEESRIHVRRRMSQDDTSHHSVLFIDFNNVQNIASLVSALFQGMGPKATISTNELLDWIASHPHHHTFLMHQLRPEYPLAGGPEEELKEYKRLFKEFNPENLVANELYYVVAKPWWSSWIQYIHGTDVDKVLHVHRPGSINNSNLMENDQLRLLSNLTEKKEYMIITDSLWNAIYHWYGGGPIISRRVIRASNNKLELELYPLLLHICMCNEDGTPDQSDEQLLCSKVQTVERVKKRICQIYDLEPSRCRLWILEEAQDNDILLKDEKKTLEDLELCEEAIVMIEERNANGAFIYGRSDDRKSQRVNKVPGLTGLENLGNTCYMNSALQCLIHTDLLKDYFVSGEFMNDINTEGDEALHGEFANAFGILVSAMWEQQVRVIAPRRFKNELCMLQPQFQGYTQHDAQELLSVVIDGLNEDLNKTLKKPYVELDGEYCSESELARRYWVLYCAREQSIITALFCGQFKSLAQCAGCNYCSAKFDPFTVLQLPLPKTEMKALSLVLSYSNGRVPVQCSLRVPADSTINDIKEALNELDHSFNLSDARIQLSRVENNNVVEVYDPSNRLNELSLSDFTVFVLPPEGEYLGKRAYEQYMKKVSIPTVTIGQVHKLILKGPNGLPLTGKVVEVFSDFRFSVACSDGHIRRLMITDFEDCNDYMLRPGEFVFVEIEKQKFSHGIYLGSSNTYMYDCIVRIFPSEQEITVSLTQLYRRNPRPRYMYIIQRYLGINDNYYLGFNTPIMAGVPQAIEILPEFVTGSQLYQYISHHFRKTISNPITQTAMNTMNSSSRHLMPRVLTRTASVHIPQPLCSSFIDSELPFHHIEPAQPSNSDEDSESRSSRGQNDLFKEEWGYMKEEDLEAKIGRAYGFVLKMVDVSGTSCISCHWLKGCTGCVIIPDDNPLNCLSMSRKIAVDWESDFLKEHFHQILYENTVAHGSVGSVDMTGKQNILLEECLEKFAQTEILQEEQKLRCDHCKLFTNHYLSLRIWRTPPILVIHLKRFHSGLRGYTKLQFNVEFPLTDLDISRFVVSESHNVGTADLTYWEKLGGQYNLEQGMHTPVEVVEKIEKKWADFEAVHATNTIPTDRSSCTKYDLYGVVNHHGEMEGGHYIATVLAADGKWYSINDSRYIPIAPANVLSPYAYILFYVRQDVKGLDFRSLFHPEKEVEETSAEEMEDEEEKKKCTIM